LKVALIINGIYRPHVQRAKELVANMVDTFRPDQVFFQTWDNHKDKLLGGLMLPMLMPKNSHFRNQSIPFYTPPEPIMNYHPVGNNPGAAKHGKYKNYSDKKLMWEKLQHASKQILGYAHAFEQASDFDVYIRTRYDVLVDPKMDWDYFLEESANGPIGFGIRPNRGQTLDGTYKILPRENYEGYEKERGCLFEHDDWYGFLPDPLIIHRKEHFDVNLVNSLHESGKLICGEWGWYQVMSEPYNDWHLSVHGGATIIR